MNSERDTHLWVETYRPKTVQDCILPQDLKSTFQEYVNKKEIPNLMLSGGPGVGKTTIARALCEEIGCDYIMINGSMDGNIDTLRNEIKTFASSVSFVGGTKVVIIDEADYLNPQSTQPALRGFIEEFSKNCTFIFTCNFKNRIIAAIHSRCSVIDFQFAKKDKPGLAANFLHRLETILLENGITYDKQVISELLIKYFPDYRRVLNELQRYSAVGQIDSGILAKISDINLTELMESMKEKNFKNARKWITNNLDNDSVVLFRSLYDHMYNFIKSESIPQLVVILAEYQYKSAFCIDQELNTMAMIVEIMSDVEFV
jgi:DNA polymerase III delta prime subunit